MDDYLDSFDEYDDIEPDESRMEAFMAHYENQTDNERKMKGLHFQETLERYDGDLDNYFFSDEFL